MRPKKILKELINPSNGKRIFQYLLATIVLIGLTFRAIMANDGNVDKYLILAAILGFYLAMAMGANDVANNMGPAVGAKALNLVGAVLIAAVFEAAGALIAWWDVTQTIKWGIISPTAINDPQIFLHIMIATLLGGAIWVNVATFMRIPVSATHSTIWALLGAGLMAVPRLDIINWGKIGEIVMSWIVSPLMWGILAAIFSYIIVITIFRQKDRYTATQKWLPVFVGVMAGVFTVYLMLKGLKKVVSIDLGESLWMWTLVWLITYMGLRIYLQKHNGLFKNSKKSIKKMFNIPLVFAVSLLSFAHWSNDVANAIGPVAAINDLVKNGKIVIGSTHIPTWIMMLGGLGLAVWLMIWGAKIIKTVGKKITKIDQPRAFSIALATAITVILASHLGLPISTTHVAIWGVFGVGFLREFQKRRRGKTKDYIEKEIVRNIVLAWVVTLPIAGFLAALTYFILSL